MTATAAGETQRTTAHLTAVLDDRFFNLENLFGEDKARLAAERMEEDAAHVARLRDIAVEALAGWTINGSVERRYAGNLNVRRDGVNAIRLLSDCREVAFSLGSACGKQGSKQ